MILATAEIGAYERCIYVDTDRNWDTGGSRGNHRCCNEK